MSVKTLNEARPSDDDSKCLLTGSSALRGAEVEELVIAGTDTSSGSSFETQKRHFDLR